MDNKSPETTTHAPSIWQIRTPWVERVFLFNLPPGWIADVLERLHGTSLRIEALIKGLTDEQLSVPASGTWSIKEHIGHLSDLEPLHDGRIDDFLERKPILRAADMNNLKTNQAKHNSKPIEQLVTEFKTLRKKFTSRLSLLDAETMQFVSQHPRLQQPMRPVDMAFFTAEHDDHHLATMRQIREGLHVD